LRHTCPPLEQASNVSATNACSAQRSRRTRRPAISYFHSHSCALPLPVSSTSHSPTPTMPFKRDQREDIVCMIHVYRHVAARPLPVGFPPPLPDHIRASPSLLLTSPCPLPCKTPAGVITDS